MNIQRSEERGVRSEQKSPYFSAHSFLLTPHSFFLCLVLLLAGCKNKDLVENELRARDIQYREALDELKKSEFQKDALSREVESLRAGRMSTPEGAAHSFGIRRITLGRRAACMRHQQRRPDKAQPADV